VSGEKSPCKICNSAALIFPSIDTNWQQNSFLTSFSLSAPPALECDELPSLEIIPNFAGKVNQVKLLGPKRFFPGIFTDAFGIFTFHFDGLQRLN